MKKTISILLVLLMAVTMMPVKVYAADGGGDNVIDQASDWFATIGKSGMDKDAILFQRRSERASKRLGKAMNEAGKKMGDDMKKSFGS